MTAFLPIPARHEWLLPDRRPLGKGPVQPQARRDPVDAACAVRLFRLGEKVAQTPDLKQGFGCSPGEHVLFARHGNTRNPA